MPTLPQFLSQAFNGIALGSMLALIASGLSIILGTLGVLNFAHGAMFMLGAYTGFVVLSHWDSFAAALALGAFVLLLVGWATERGLIRFYYSRPPEDQILVTFGLGIMMVEAVRYAFGPLSQRVPLPSWGQGIVNFGFFLYPLYRVQVIGIVAVLLLGFYLMLYRTRIGLVVRAGIEDPLMVELLGTNVRRAFMVVFSLGRYGRGDCRRHLRAARRSHPQYGRAVPGGVLRCRRDRRARIVSRRGGRRTSSSVRSSRSPRCLTPPTPRPPSTP